MFSGKTAAEEPSKETHKTITQVSRKLHYNEVSSRRPVSTTTLKFTHLKQILIEKTYMLEIRYCETSG